MEKQLLMNQKERDRLVALKKAKIGLITQKQAAEEIGLTERQVRRLLLALRRRGDQAVIHAGRGRRSNRRIEASIQTSDRSPMTNVSVDGWTTLPGVISFSMM